MKLEWLSYPLGMNAPRPPAIPAPSVTEFMSIRDSGANVQLLKCYNHTGTHLDTAAHVLEGGTSIEEFEPEDLLYEGIKVIDLSGLADDTVVTEAHLEPFFGKEEEAKVEALLVKFNVAERRLREPEKFSKHCPGFCPESARFIHEKLPGLRMIGTDVPSIACIPHLEKTMEAHHEFFRKASLKKFILIEEMRLDGDLSDIQEILVSPWLVEGMNSGPCVIWARKKED